MTGMQINQVWEMLTFLSTHENLWWGAITQVSWPFLLLCNYLLLHFWVRILVAAVITNTKYFSGYLKDMNLILIFIKWDCWHDYLYWGTRHRLIWECGVQESFLTLTDLSHHQGSICYVPMFSPSSSNKLSLYSTRVHDERYGNMVLFAARQV